MRIRGVASSAAFRRPAGVPVAVRVAGGVSRLRVDGRSRERSAGLKRYIGPGYAESPDRYELEVLGGASEVIVN